jgi:hypothetical protein
VDVLAHPLVGGMRSFGKLPEIERPSAGAVETPHGELIRLLAKHAAKRRRRAA